MGVHWDHLTVAAVISVLIQHPHPLAHLQFLIFLARRPGLGTIAPSSILNFSPPGPAFTLENGGPKVLTLTILQSLQGMRLQVHYLLYILHCKGLAWGVRCPH